MPPRKPTSANDNRPDTKPMQHLAWNIYRASVRARWIGRVIADGAIEAAAVEFGSDAWKRTAVCAHEISMEIRR
jgi:hypothetical protein